VSAGQRSTAQFEFVFAALMLQLLRLFLAMRKRLLISALVGLAAGLFCAFVLRRTQQHSGDFHWALHLAGRLLARQNPYDTPDEQYPLPAAFFALPFLHLRPEIAAGAFYGISSFLLAFGLTRNNFLRLRAFVAYPFWAGALTAQWSTLIAAGAFFPVLLPATMAKPQVGLPVFLTRITRRGLLYCVLLGALSLLVLPNWPRLWLGQTRYYEHFIPLLVFPGPLLLLALLRCRHRDAWLLLLSAVMPQRWFFDSFTLWLIPKSRREFLFTIPLSWVAGIWRWYHLPDTFAQVGRTSVICFYLPMLVVILLRPTRPPLKPSQVSA
jgi:hypothetical protein